MRAYVAVVLALVSVAGTAQAQSMNAEEFHRRATALKAKGAMALFSGGEIKALMHEGQASGEAARQQRLAAEKAGQPRRYCPPPGPQKMTSDEFMQRLGAIPAADRAKINMTEATNRILAVKFPCGK
ncbi:hypothetical protein [Sphingomonas jaspsi]|uniref:hypothetical protein n=1 Tax=Sphingomonas jaspsi TaxID=392409 RepID=UPI0004B32B55|nr:hypothetical protein [Sphingomonas jaspsi]